MNCTLVIPSRSKYSVSFNIVGICQCVSLLMQIFDFSFEKAISFEKVNLKIIIRNEKLSSQQGLSKRS